MIGEEVIAYTFSAAYIATMKYKSLRNRKGLQFRGIIEYDRFWIDVTATKNS